MSDITTTMTSTAESTVATTANGSTTTTTTTTDIVSMQELRFELSRKMEELEQYKQTSETQKVYIERRMKEARDAIVEWRRENETLTSQVKELQNKNQSLEEEQKAAVLASRKGTTTTTGGTEEAKEYGEDASAARIALLESLMETLEGEVKTLRAEKMKSEQATKELQTTHENQLQAQQEYIVSKMNQAKEAIEEWREANTELTQQSTECQTEVASLTEMLTATERRAVQLENEIRTMEVNDLSHQEEKEVLEKDLVRHKEEVKSQKAACRMVQNQLAEFQNESERRIRSVQEELQTTQTQLSLANQKLQQQDQDTDVNDVQSRSWTVEKDTLIRQVEQLQMENRALKTNRNRTVMFMISLFVLMIAMLIKSTVIM